MKPKGMAICLAGILLATPGLAQAVVADFSKVEIYQIQKNIAEYDATKVVTTGVVTAVLPGRSGVIIQTKTANVPADNTSSSGVFVVTDGDYNLGDELEVTGIVKKDGVTKLTDTGIEVLGNGQQDQVKVPTLTPPRTEEEATARESMAFFPKGTYRVQGNDELIYTGQISISDGDKPLTQPTQMGAPGSKEAQDQAKYNQEHLFVLDDGSDQHFDVKFFEKFSPEPPQALPYLSLDKPGPTLGATVTFHKPVVVTKVGKNWVLDPVTSTPTSEEVSFSAVSEDAPAKLTGNFRVATFNVLNYFVHLGENSTATTADGKPLCEPVYNLYDKKYAIAANWDCPNRGAWNTASLKRQEAKIVAAINKLGSAGAQIVGLQEIENGLKFGDDYDVALKALVNALNVADPTQGWQYVPAPKTMPEYGNDDVIRQAFIYKPADIDLVGESFFLDDPAYQSAADARAPLAQTFRHKATDRTIFLVNNHLTYKGGKVVGDDNANPGDKKGPAWDTGRNNGDRTRQAEALTNFVEKHGANADMTVLVGDFNSYSYETPITTFTDKGYADLMNVNEYPSKHSATDFNEFSYSYRATFGSLDHVLVSKPAMKYWQGMDIWTANAYESKAREYSRYLFTGTDYYAADVFRASDHNAAIVAFELPKVVSATPVNPPKKPVVLPDTGC